MSWDQLAAAVRARRIELGLGQVDAAAAGRISVDLFRNVENGRRTPKRVNPRTARAIETALEWEPGSFAATVAGGRPTPINTKSRRARTPTRETAATDQPTSDIARAQGPPAATAQLDSGDRFALARQILALRSALSEHQRAISPDAREALLTEMANSAREAEDSIVRIMPWLSEEERGEAIGLLVKLREPLG